MGGQRKHTLLFDSRMRHWLLQAQEGYQKATALIRVGREWLRWDPGCSAHLVAWSVDESDGRLLIVVGD